MVDASQAGTMNVIRQDDSLSISICPNIPLNDSLVVTIAGNRHFSALVRVKPMQVYNKAIPYSAADSQRITVAVGKHLLFYSNDPERLKTDRPIKSAVNQDFSSPEHLFRLAEDENAMRNYPEALDYYLACLKQIPTHSRALTKAAELFYRRAEYTEGLRLARKVLENDTYDAGANFISGVIHRRLGNLVHAEEYFSIAARTMEYRSGAYLQMAAIRMLEKDFELAIEYAVKALDFNRYNIPAYELLAAGYRKINDIQASEETLKDLLQLDPLNHYARFEQHLLNPGDASLNRFNAAIRNELPHETYLELALEYASLGLEDEAIRVLLQSPPYPTVYYWLAYLYRNISTEKSGSYLSQAEALSPHLVFPYRLETIPVLDWAMKQDDSWKHAYYLGLIYWHIGQTDKTRELFEQCGDMPDYAPFYLARGFLFQHKETEPCLSCSDFSRAITLNPEEWRTWHYLSKFLQLRGAFREQLEYAEKSYDRFPANPVIGIDYAKALLNNNKPASCLDLLRKVLILPQEGAHEGHDIYEAANLALAVERLEKKKYREAIRYIDDSEIWPENLGAGKPYEPETRFQDFVSAYCFTQLGNSKLADDHLNRIIRYSQDHWGNTGEPANTWLSIQVMTDHGKQQTVTRAMDIWKAEQDSLRDWRISSGSASPKVQWVLAKYKGETEKAESLEKDIAAEPGEYRFRLFLKTMSIINRKGNEK